MQNIIAVNRHSQPHLKKMAMESIDGNTPILQSLYPDFDQWLTKKVRTGLDKGTRSIILSVTDGMVSGFAIVKDDPDEKKLCCLRVMDTYRHKYGIGDKLFRKSFEILDTEKPLLSISEDMLPAYHKLFEHYGFTLEGVHHEYYRPKKTEFSYNGPHISPPYQNA